MNAFIGYHNEFQLDTVGKRMYIFDLVAKKAGKIYIIEVKSTKSAMKFLKGKRLRGLLLAQKYGFISIII